MEISSIRLVPLCALLIVCLPIKSRLVRENDENKSLAQEVEEKESTPRPSRISARQERAEERKRKKQEQQTKQAAKKAKKQMTPQATLDDSSKQIAQLQQETDQRIAQIKEDAQTKVDQSISEREQELASVQKHQQDLMLELAALHQVNSKTLEPETTSPLDSANKNSKSTKEPVPVGWKIDQASRFNRLSTTLAQTVSAGENDSIEQNDFKDLFNTQQQWFDSSLTQTEYVGDAHYRAINLKNEHLEKIVALQQAADLILAQRLNLDQLPKHRYDQIRTVLLYNLNALLIDPKRWNGKIPSDEELTAAVTMSIEEAQDPVISSPSKKQQMIDSLQKNLKEAQQQLEDKSKKVIELQITVESNKNEIAEIKKQITDAYNSKKELEIQLKDLTEKHTKEMEEAKRAKVTLQIKSTQAESELKSTKEKLDKLNQASTAMTTEKEALVIKAKELEQRLNELENKKKDTEKTLEEETHKRRTLELTLEQDKLKEEQGQQSIKNLEHDNQRLDQVKKELSDMLEAQNKRAIELQIELEHLKRSQNDASPEGLEELRKEFKKEINELRRTFKNAPLPPEPDIPEIPEEPATPLASSTNPIETEKSSRSSGINTFTPTLELHVNANKEALDKIDKNAREYLKARGISVPAK